MLLRVRTAPVWSWVLVALATGACSASERSRPREQSPSGNGVPASGEPARSGVPSHGSEVDPGVPSGQASTAYQPCARRTCGEPCSLCRPGDATCSEEAGVKACDPHGRCVPAGFECERTGVTTQVPPAAYEPCASKKCGDACTVCPVGDSMCMETAVVKACDGAGQCRPAPVNCGSGSMPLPGQHPDRPLKPGTGKPATSGVPDAPPVPPNSGQRPAPVPLQPPGSTR